MCEECSSLQDVYELKSKTRSFGEEGGWGTRITDQLQRKCDVINRGFSGYNTRWARMLLPRVITPQMAPHVHLVTIFLGANDAALEEVCQQQHVPLDEFKSNLVAMVEYLLSIGIRRSHILLIGNPPCDEVKWEVYCTETRGWPLNRSNQAAKLYSDACRETAKRLHVSHVNLHDSMMASPDWKQLLNDGLHLSREGGEFVYQQVWPWLEEKTKDLPSIFPLWDEVDYRDPAKTLTPGAAGD